MKRIITTLAAVIASAFIALTAGGQAPERTVDWKVSSDSLGDGEYEILFDGTIISGWHTYSTTSGINPATVEFNVPDGCTLTGGIYDKLDPVAVPGLKDATALYGRILIGQKVRVLDGAAVSGTIHWNSCNEETCAMPEDYEFSITIGNAQTAADAVTGEAVSEASAPAGGSTEGASSVWGFILEAILWGFAMLLTPCVFPMIPMTISFFMKGSSSPAAGRFKAFMYGLFIVLLYTVPICVIIGLTWIVGGATVTADIFNWLATHWLPNIIFFIVFMLFAASFFGAFEITLPSSLVNKSDKHSDKGGLIGVFFMALTLVLVSFSCTGPIVGTVLIKSTSGEFWTPMVTMLAFSVAFALPFTVLAMFPSLLGKLKSGSWLNSVKVVLGFVEIALGFKFLSVADQTYHWGLLDREVYLAIWITVFTLLGLYLLGKIRFSADSEVKHIGVFRLALVIIDFSFVVYMIPGMFGAPLKALSGYLPPLETQDFIAADIRSAAVPSSGAVSDAGADKYGLSLPLGLSGYFTLDEGLKAAEEIGKPILVDITGHGCVNCREMEQRVWSDPAVLEKLRNDFIIVALYTDDKTVMPESEWITAENGKVLKDMGRINSYFVRKTFGVNAQPNYVILSPDGGQLGPVRGYNLDVNGYLEFLDSGLKKINRQ